MQHFLPMFHCSILIQRRCRSIWLDFWMPRIHVCLWGNCGNYCVVLKKTLVESLLNLLNRRKKRLKRDRLVYLLTVLVIQICLGKLSAEPQELVYLVEFNCKKQHKIQLCIQLFICIELVSLSSWNRKHMDIDEVKWGFAVVKSMIYSIN